MKQAVTIEDLRSYGAAADTSTFLRRSKLVSHDWSEEIVRVHQEDALDVVEIKLRISNITLNIVPGVTPVLSFAICPMQSRGTVDSRVVIVSGSTGHEIVKFIGAQNEDLQSITVSYPAYKRAIKDIHNWFSYRPLRGNNDE